MILIITHHSTLLFYFRKIAFKIASTKPHHRNNTISLVGEIWLGKRGGGEGIVALAGLDVTSSCYHIFIRVVLWIFWWEIVRT